MKKLLLFLPIALLLSFSTTDPTLTKEEKEYLGKFLKQTEQGLFDAVKGLSEAQLKFKAAPEKWSIEECVKHIAISEQNIWGMVSGLMKQPATPEKRSDVKATDDQVIKMIIDRSQKGQAPETFKPENAPFKSTADALESFKLNRNKLIDYMKDTNEDFRNHVTPFPVGGSLDGFQMVLLIGAHSKRHTLQIDEVKADPSFPKE